jgi:hypothetical protein
MTNIDIHTIVSTIENYENKTVTPISVSHYSVQSAVNNNNSVQPTVTTQPQNNTIPIHVIYFVVILMNKHKFFIYF